ncbi:hypothetical protein NE604_03205 [Anaerofustis stercorihominis]|uniref:Uncharacterized protein n=1 Tax=Anaerofustis stercorihominis DSM 17244 TaxID=445971 RepID=B1C5X9_9FIRM|nr:hypothetical protein [Anaerofustis stercorihominis]EDS73548.1 hypothetical protein ANASTE_00117 [Anaerofustis stercorihominis DSM 17244]MCQ4794647.1 hypothetical protein [Anaerofustis stercorihominis]
MKEYKYIGIDMDNQTKEKLNKICKSNNISEQEAIHQIISSLKNHHFFSNEEQK